MTRNRLRISGLWRGVELSGRRKVETVSDALVDGKAIGWIQVEWNLVRALGGRSILADARSPKMQKQLNKIKYMRVFGRLLQCLLRERREWFRLDSDSLTSCGRSCGSHEQFKIERDGLLVVSKCLKSQRSQVPAVTHVDWSENSNRTSRDK